MYIISFRLHGAPPQIQLGELTALPQTSQLDFRRPTFKGNGGEDRRKEERGGRGISTTSVMSELVRPEIKKSRALASKWTKPYYLAVKHSNIMKYEQ